MNADYEIHAEAALRITSTVQVAGEAAERAGDSIESALEELAGAGSGSPSIAAALNRFSAARSGSGPTIAEHLSRVGEVGRSAVTVVAQADEAAARDSRGLT